DEYDLRRRDLGPRADLIGELQPIHLRHRDVGEDRVGPHPQHELEPFASIRREVHLVRRRPHRGLHELADRRIVLDEHDLAHRAQASTAWLVAARGSTTWKVDPRPTSLSAHTRPPCIVTIWRTIGSPRPVPWIPRVCADSTREYC